MIKIRNLSVAYKKSDSSLALDHLNLFIDKGEQVAIMGASGCGKSTLLAVIGGMLRPTSGEYEFQGKSIFSMSTTQSALFRGEHIGFVFQNFALLPNLTILENLLIPFEHLTHDRNVVMRRATSLLERVGIAGLTNRFPREVSGGQAQRAAIARALMRNPSIILADEPTGSLDEDSADEILKLLNSFGAEGTTVVIVTHSVRVAEGMKRIIHLQKGRVVECAVLTPLAA